MYATISYPVDFVKQKNPIAATNVHWILVLFGGNKTVPLSPPNNFDLGTQLFFSYYVGMCGLDFQTWELGMVLSWK